MSRILLLFFIILCSLSIAFPQTVLYTETFSEGTLDNPWYPGFRASLKSDAKVVEPYNLPGNPSGDGWVGRLSTFYSLTDTVGVASSFSGDLTWTDYYVEAWFYILVDNDPISGAEYYTLEFRIDSTGNSSAYQFAATFNPGAMFAPAGLRFRKRIEGQASTIHHWNSDNIPGGLPTINDWHKLSVNVIGDQFWFYFNDQEMPGNPYTDTTSTTKFNQGGIGLYGFRFNFINPSPVDTISVIVDDIKVTEAITSIPIDKNASIINDYNLEQNYPNPFNPTTTIKFELPISEFIQLEVFNMVGQKVRTLANNLFNAGNQQVVWDAHDDFGNEVPAGLYYYRLRAGTFEQTRKMLLVK